MEERAKGSKPDPHLSIQRPGSQIGWGPRPRHYYIGTVECISPTKARNLEVLRIVARDLAGWWGAPTLVENARFRPTLS